jgi:hypothetical protein
MNRVTEKGTQVSRVRSKLLSLEIILSLKKSILSELINFSFNFIISSSVIIQLESQCLKTVYAGDFVVVVTATFRMIPALCGLSRKEVMKYSPRLTLLTVSPHLILPSFAIVPFMVEAEKGKSFPCHKMRKIPNAY